MHRYRLYSDDILDRFVHLRTVWTWRNILRLRQSMIETHTQCGVARS